MSFLSSAIVSSKKKGIIVWPMLTIIIACTFAIKSSANFTSDLLDKTVDDLLHFLSAVSLPLGFDRVLRKNALAVAVFVATATTLLMFTSEAASFLRCFCA